MTEAALTFRELLDYSAEDVARWLGWFVENPEALDVAYGAPPLATVRDVVRHVAFVEHRYAAILAGREVPAASGTPRDDARLLMAYIADARERLEAAIAALGQDGLERRIEFMTLTRGLQQASARKIAAHALMHGVRHYAQLATVLRQHGHPASWPHDLLMSSALR